jgi:hypothetical protein
LEHRSDHLHADHHYRSAEVTVIQEMFNDARMTSTTTQYEGQQVSKSETKNLEGSVGVYCENQTSNIITVDKCPALPLWNIQYKVETL